MANEEHVDILRQGFKVWNKWRQNNPDVEPDFSDSNFRDVDLHNSNLSGANLIRANLSNMEIWEADFVGANLSYANLNHAKLVSVVLRGTNLSHADLCAANLHSGDLRSADLRAANLHSTNLRLADLRLADLSNVNLHSADFNSADLRLADLSSANLSHTDLRAASLMEANLSSANLEHSICGTTNFGNVDLSTTKGLDTVIHRSPSTLGVDTIFKSKGKIPEIFLRGCGVPETLITFLPSMTEEAIQFYSCFISYSHADKEFAKRLHDRLQGVGIRCWLDEFQLNPGDKLHSTIYEAIRVYDKVILCCSETALKSWWVEKEFENATIKEMDYAETVLIPITLDRYLFEQSANHHIIGEIREKRVVQDFSNWKDHDAFEAAFEKVVKALRTDGGKPPPPASKLTRRK